MKILEAQSGVLTNYEVYDHLTEKDNLTGGKKQKRRGPGNLETVVKELLEYLRKAPSPLGETPLPYNNTTIRTLLQRLRPYDLTKAEVLMILNHRPTKVAALNTIVEELEERFPEHSVQNDIVKVIVAVLGSPDQELELQKMTNAAKDARDADAADVPRDDDDAMEVDGA